MLAEPSTKGENIGPAQFAGKEESRPWYLFRWQLIVLVAVLVFIGGIRWRLLDMPLERDEGEYAYAGQLLLQGIPPYQLAYNMKLPGTYGAYAVILAVFGQTSRGIHLGLLIINVVSAILLYLIAARLFGALAGTIAGSSYALLSTHQAVLGFAAHATHFVVLATLIGLILLLRAEQTKRRFSFFWSGLAFGFAFLMKQPGVLLGAFAFFYMVVQFWPKNQREWSSWAKNLASFLLAGTLPFALTCALLYKAGVFQNFWFWTVSYAHQYATALPLRSGLEVFKGNFSHILRATPGLLLLALVGVIAIFVDCSARRHSLFVIGLLVFSFAAVCPGFYFREHYFVLMLPAVAILIAVSVTSAIRLLGSKLTYYWRHALPVSLFIFASFLAVYSNADFYFRVTPVRACRVCYPREPFVEALSIAEYLRQHTAPTESIMVFGSEPEIYFYARRHSASGFIYTYGLVDEQAYWPRMQKQMMQEVEANEPAYAVFVDLWGSWNARWGAPQTVGLARWMNRYLSDEFQEVGIVQVGDPESRFSPGSIHIFKRKGPS